MHIGRFVAVAGFVALGVMPASSALAQLASFRIAQIFSSLDGNLQFVELTETAGLNGQHRFAGMTLTVARDGMHRVFTFPHDLPSDQTANISVVVAVAPRGTFPLGDLWNAFNYRPAYTTLPPRFLPIGGATLDFAGVDRISYASLPTDGSTSLDRHGALQRATGPLPACAPPLQCSPRRRVAHTYIAAIEYYHATRDHYFVTAHADEIEALDSGRMPGWRRTGESFIVGAAPYSYPGFGQPVCRLYIGPDAGDSHFFSAWPDECAAARASSPHISHATDAAFHVASAHFVTGACPFDEDLNGGGPLQPLYRLWNGRADSNHRYTTKPAVRDAMLARGYVSEGFGPDGVAMCVR